ncbi:MAG: ParB/RepB/Spo0J family partition protein [Chthoniobacterales bacterium]
MKNKIQLIPISKIRILNPRHRNPSKFAVIVESIKTLGLKKPIRISSRLAEEEMGDEGYDLVCGQGRLEAFIKLGWMEIPAIVEDISKEDRLLMSLVENMSRRFPRPMDLIQEVIRLKEQGYSNVQIGTKIGIADSFVSGLLTLSNSGEERLLEAAIMGKIPLGVAIDISKAGNVEEQRAFLQAYQDKQLNQRSIRVVKRLIEQRRLYGKRRGRDQCSGKTKRTTAESMVDSYRKEAQKQKTMIKKHRICETKLVFLTSAMKRLIDDSDFRDILKAEHLDSMPKYFHEQLD